MPIKPGSPDPARPRLPFTVPRWVIRAGFFLVVAAAASGAFIGHLLNADLPDVRALEDYQPPTITQILDVRGEVVHQFAEQKRIMVPLSGISESLQQAVIAVEDSSFYSHIGVDPWAIARAIVRDLREGRWAEGGSTLTQQLAKILFLKPEKTVRRKLQEALLAMHIEKTYTKQEILEFYLNQIYMGHGRYGVEAASQYYFGGPSSDLTLEQAALLAGLIQRPESYSPLRNPERATARRNKVLSRMRDEGIVTPEEASAASEAPVQVAERVTDDSPAPYFAEEIRKVLSSRYGDDALLREGLVIQTHLDLDLQKVANEAISRGLRDLDKRQGWRAPEHNVLREELGTLEDYRHPGWDRPLQKGSLVTGLVMDATEKTATIRLGALTATLRPEDAAWTRAKGLASILAPGDLVTVEIASIEDGEVQVILDQEPLVEGAAVALDPQTGDVLALVGGFDFNRSQFNRATQAKRQSGSAFKPFVFAAALTAGHRPSDLLFDEPTIFVDSRTGEAYQPENYSRRYAGVVTLRRALEKSINVPTVTLLNDVGYTQTVNLARRLGFTSTLHPYPSLALGSSEVTLLEVTAAYAPFPAGGIFSTPRFYQEIRDRDGNVLEHVDRERREVLRADVAAVMTSLLQGVVQRGTGNAANSLGTALAGKTGTTDDYTDAWFIGFSPSLVLGVWVGHDTKTSLGTSETGAQAALPIWMDVMRAWLNDHPNEDFPQVAGVVTLPVDADTGLRVAPELGCRTVIMESFLEGTEIERPCTANAHFRVSLPYYLQRYRIVDGSAEIDDGELERLLRENPFDLELYGRSLSVQTADGPRVIRLAHGGFLGTDVTWGVFRFPTSGTDGPAEDLHYVQLLPDQVPPVDGSSNAHLGLDGRSAAVIEIRR